MVNLWEQGRINFWEERSRMDLKIFYGYLNDFFHLITTKVRWFEKWMKKFHRLLREFFSLTKREKKKLQSFKFHSRWNFFISKIERPYLFQVLTRRIRKDNTIKSRVAPLTYSLRKFILNLNNPRTTNSEIDTFIENGLGECFPSKKLD